MTRQIMSSMKNFIEKKICYILPVITIVLAALLMFSYLVPKKVIDTYETNITEDDGDEEQIQPLDAGTTLSYHMNTGTRPIMGIHVAVAKRENHYHTSRLLCNVATEDGTMLSENSYDLSQGENTQYVYIPFADYEKCEGDIVIAFTYDQGQDEGVTAPGLLVNGKVLINAHTELNGAKIEQNLKTIYIYTHDTYPLVYDLRILVALFFAASMMVNYHGFFDYIKRIKKTDRTNKANNVNLKIKNTTENKNTNEEIEENKNSKEEEHA